MRNVHLLVAVLALACSSEHVFSAEKMLAKAWKDDSALGKTFTVSGTVTQVKDQVVFLAAGRNLRVELAFPKAQDAAAHAAGETLTATCKLVGSTIHAARLEACEARKS
jgi:hypothetical protein